MGHVVGNPVVHQICSSGNTTLWYTLECLMIDNAFGSENGYRWSCLRAGKRLSCMSHLWSMVAPPSGLRKGYSTILYVTFSFVLLRLFSSLVNISEKFSQIIINLKPSKKELGSLIHFSWFQIWILVPTPTLNLVETKLYIRKINVKTFLPTIFFSGKIKPKSN